MALVYVFADDVLKKKMMIQEDDDDMCFIHKDRDDHFLRLLYLLFLCFFGYFDQTLPSPASSLTRYALATPCSLSLHSPTPPLSLMEAFTGGSSQDTLVIKTPKRSPLIFRTFAILFTMVCGVYICSFSVTQTNSGKNNTSTTRFLKVNIKEEESCPNMTNMDDPERRYLHYPTPKTFNRDECVCNPVRYFVIVSMQRSGSGWFETLLNNHTNVSCNGEIFAPSRRRTNISTIYETLDKVYNLDLLTSASKNHCSAAVGFKWMLNQGLVKHHKEIAEYFNRNGVSVIFLFRRNLLLRMVSLLANVYDSKAKLLNGTHKSHVHSSIEAQILANYTPEIPVNTLLHELKQKEEDIAKAISYFNSTRHIVLYYEDLIRNQTKLKDVQNLLKLPYRDLKSRQVKIHTGPLSRHVANWDDVRKTLNGTSYEKFLYSS